MTASVDSRVHAQRIYEPAQDADGLRVLTTRYWPRGVSRDAVDEYVPALAPSRPLLSAYRTGEISWSQFREQYLAEMNGEEQRAEVHRLAKVARSGPITILCVCDETEHCHRWLLRDLVCHFDED